jgi:hypothetical protein
VIRRSPFVAVLALLACGYGLFAIGPDLRFALEGEARPVPPAALADGLHLRVSGPAEPLGFRVELPGDTRDAWLLSDRVIVLLPVAGGEAHPGELTAVGRSYRGDRARGWSPAAAAVAAKRGGTDADYWILVAGEAPAIPWGSGALGLLLVLVLLLNVRWLHAWWRSRNPVAQPAAAE